MKTRYDLFESTFQLHEWAMKLTRWLCLVFTILFVMMLPVFAEQCPHGYRAVLEGSGPLPGGTVRQVLHMRKIDPGGYDGQWMVFRFEQYNTWDRPMPQAINETIQDKASDGSPINGVIQGSGNVMRTVIEGKIALLIAANGRLRHFQGGVAEGQISGNQITFQWLPKPNPVLSGVITTEPDPSLQVSPDRNFHAAGPHSEDKFKPRVMTYLLTNCDQQPISYAVSSPAKWLKISPAKGTIPPKGGVEITVSLSGNLSTWDDGTYIEPIQFQNLTTGQGNTTRQAKLEVRPHRWRASLQGHEIDIKDPYWEKTTKRRIDLQFNYSFEGGFEIGKKKGKWFYQNGRITAADVTFNPIVAPPEWWNVKPPVCTNCNQVKGLVGKEIMGLLFPLDSGIPSAVKLKWGYFFPKARMWSQLKPEVACSPMPDCRNSLAYKSADIYYDSAEFHDQISAPEVPLKNGVFPYSPFKKSDRLRFTYTLKRLE
jgi:hypothetical protein